MFSCQTKGFICAFLLCAVIVNVRGIALADCGKHALDTYFAPEALRVEAIPKSPATLLQVVGSVDQPTRTSDAGGLLLGYKYGASTTVQICPDDPQATAAAPQHLALLWGDAINLDDNATLYDYFKEGKTREPEACAAYDLATLKWQTAQYWSSYTGLHAFPPNGAEIVALQKLRYYSHVRALWNNLAGKLGMTLRSPGTRMESWPDGFMTTMNTLQSHLPTGVNCGGMASL